MLRFKPVKFLQVAAKQGTASEMHRLFPSMCFDNQVKSTCIDDIEFVYLFTNYIVDVAG